MTYLLLADIVAVIHGLVVLYIAGGVLLIVVGLIRRWPIARHFWFRFSHLILFLVVITFECINQPCPLTSLEHWLRNQDNQESFIQHYVSAIIHVNVQPSALALPTALIFVVVGILYVWAGPKKIRSTR